MPDDVDHVGRRLATLQLCALYRRTLRVTCPRCRRERMLDAVGLWWLFERKRWDDRMRNVPRRLRCEPCWKERNGIVRPRIDVTSLPPEGPQFPYPNERTWRRVVSRFRS